MTEGSVVLGEAVNNSLDNQALINQTPDADDKNWTEQAITQRSESKKKMWIAIFIIILLLSSAGVIIGLVVAENNDGDHHDKHHDDDDFPYDDYDKNFDFNAEVVINDYFTYGFSGIPTRISCEDMTNDVSETYSASWSTISIENVAMTAHATNYLIKCLAKTSKVAENGYTKISFKNWQTLDEELDDSDLEDLAEASPNAVSFTLDIPDFKGPVTTISAQQFQLVSFSEEMLDESKSMEAVNITGLSEDLTAEQTEKILSKWTEADNITASSLKSIAMEQFNFSSDEACQALALLVSTATSVDFFDLTNQNTERPVRITVEPATAALNGTVTISDLVTNAVIYSMSSIRTTAPTVTYDGTFEAIDFTINNAEVLIDGATIIGPSSSSITTPWTTNCNNFWQSTSEVSPELWHNWQIENAVIENSNMDTLIYCLTNSPQVEASNGYNAIGFSNVSGFNGELNPYVLN